MTAHNFPSFCWCPCQESGIRKTKWITFLCNGYFGCATLCLQVFLDYVYKSRFKEGLVCVRLRTQRNNLYLRWIAGSRDWDLRKGPCINAHCPCPGQLLQNTGVLGASSPRPESSCFVIPYCLPLATVLLPLTFGINSIHTEYLLMPTCFHQQLSPAAWAVIWSGGCAGGRLPALPAPPRRGTSAGSGVVGKPASPALGLTAQRDRGKGRRS